MMKHLKRFVAITISMVMAFQFCTNDFYLYAKTEPADPGQTQVTNEPESEPSDSTGEAAEETLSSDTGTPEPSAPVEEQPAAPVEEQPAAPVEEQPEVASTLKVEFVDVSNASVKETVEQALAPKYVGDTIRLDELGIDTNVEGYTLTEVKDKNDNTQAYTTETKDFVLTGNVTELQFVYTQNVQTDQPEDSQEPSTPQGGQEGQNSEEDQEDTDDEDSDSQTNEGEQIDDSNELTSVDVKLGGTIQYEIGENVEPFKVNCEGGEWHFRHSWKSTNTDIATVTTDKNSDWPYRQKSTQKVTVNTEKEGTAEIYCGDILILTIQITKPEVPAEELTLDETNIILKVGESKNITATTKPENATVHWDSRNPSVATVDSKGKITAEGIGTTTITASSGDIVRTVTVEVTRDTSEDVEQTAYFYFLYPGITNPGTGDDFKPGEWLYAGRGTVELPSTNGTDIGTILTGDLGIEIAPTYFVDKTITVDGFKYRFDSEGTGEYGTFSFVWDKAILSSGANNSHKWDGESGQNESLTSTPIWHIDGHLVLHNVNYVNINFMLQDIGQSGFSSVQGPDQIDKYPQMVRRGSELSSIHQPSQSAVPSTKTDSNGVVYNFNGWYIDAACTQKADFSTGVLDQDMTWYGRYTAELNLSVNNIDKTYDGVESYLTISGNVPQGYKKQYKNENGEWADISSARYIDVIEKSVDVRVIDGSNKVVWTGKEK